MLESMMQYRKPGDFFLHIDPSDQVTGDTVMKDRLARQTITNTGVSVSDDGPLPGMKSWKMRGVVGSRSRFTVAPANLVNIFTGDMTVEFWCKVIDFPSGTSVVPMGYWTQTLAQGGFIFFYQNGTYNVWWGPETEGVPFLTADRVVPLQTWAHVALVRKDNVLTLYLDGTVVASKVVSQNRGKITAAVMGGMYQNNTGGYPDSLSGTFNGNLTGIRLYAGKAKYAGAFTPTA